MRRLQSFIDMKRTARSGGDRMRKMAGAPGKLGGLTTVLGTIGLLVSGSPDPSQAQMRRGGTQATASALPKFPSGMGYDRVRSSLIRQGWTPLPLSGGKCGLGSCPSFREVIWCTGVGAEAPCFYAWKKTNTYLMVTGGGEGEVQTFLRLKRCSSITRDRQYTAVWHCN